LTPRDPEKMTSHVLEAIMPEFSLKVHHGNVLGAGKNFGSGSSREEAPIVFKRIGISIIVQDERIVP
jgi:3-isopropylmalate dehydratase small subunit